MFLCMGNQSHTAAGSTVVSVKSVSSPIVWGQGFDSFNTIFTHQWHT